MNKKYDLRTEVTDEVVKTAKEKAADTPNQSGYNAAWLHGYADALRDVSNQQKRTWQIVNDILGYLSDLWDDEKLYDVLHNSVGISNEELDMLGFESESRFGRFFTDESTK